MNESIEVSTSGKTLKVNGVYSALIFLLALALGALFFMIHGSMTTLDKGQQVIIREMGIQTYILSRPEADRPKLSMPPELRDRLERVLPR
jgi:hypothetical protein